MYIYIYSFTNSRSYLNHLKRIFMYVTDLTCSFLPVWYLNFRGFAGQFTREIVARWARDPRDDMGGHGSHDTTHGLLLLLLFFAYFVHVLHNVNRFARMDRISFMSEVSTYTLGGFAAIANPFCHMDVTPTFGQVHPSSNLVDVHDGNLGVIFSYPAQQKDRSHRSHRSLLRWRTSTWFLFHQYRYVGPPARQARDPGSGWAKITVENRGLGESQEAKHTRLSRFDLNFSSFFLVS